MYGVMKWGQFTGAPVVVMSAGTLPEKSTNRCKQCARFSDELCCKEKWLKRLPDESPACAEFEQVF